jgi:Spy/CpxP family protein refolding chaperone
MNILKTKTLLLSAMALAASAALATAQNANDPNRPADRADRRGNFEDFRQRMNERLKASLKVTDEEWAVIQPLLEKVQAKQRDAAGSRFGGRGPGGPGGGTRGGDQANRDQGNRDQGNRPDRAGSAESQALRTALENENSSPEELKAKLTAVRDSRKKTAAELEQAREELRKVLTLRQEATLVTMGLLE